MAPVATLPAAAVSPRDDPPGGCPRMTLPGGYPRMTPRGVSQDDPPGGHSGGPATGPSRCDRAQPQG